MPFWRELTYFNNFDKAFDTLEWEYLYKVLSAVNFGAYFFLMDKSNVSFWLIFVFTLFP